MITDNPPLRHNKTWYFGLKSTFSYGFPMVFPLVRRLSPHLCYLLDTGFLDVRCCGGHSHVRIQGSLTKPSATYVDGLALHVATAFRDALRKKRAEGNLEPETQGHETVLANDVMLSSKWSVVRAWFWKRLGHINVLETSAAVSNLVSVGRRLGRSAHHVDSVISSTQPFAVVLCPKVVLLPELCNL